MCRGTCPSYVLHYSAKQASDLWIGGSNKEQANKSIFLCLFSHKATFSAVLFFCFQSYTHLALTTDIPGGLCRSFQFHSPLLLYSFSKYLLRTFINSVCAGCCGSYRRTENRILDFAIIILYLWNSGVARSLPGSWAGDWTIITFLLHQFLWAWEGFLVTVACEVWFSLISFCIGSLSDMDTNVVLSSGVKQQHMATAHTLYRLGSWRYRLPHVQGQFFLLYPEFDHLFNIYINKCLIYILNRWDLILKNLNILLMFSLCSSDLFLSVSWSKVLGFLKK